MVFITSAKLNTIFKEFSRMPKPETLSLIEKLVSFDTTSRNSNLELISFIDSYLSDLGVSCTLIHNAEKTKANLYATIGPTDKPGIMLSGHTDVVPVDGQDWHNDPFEVVLGPDRLFGRGTCDMKGFIAICLAYAPEFLKQKLTTPIHFAFSYDEEVGCIGVHSLLDMLKGMPIKPAMCIVGEPTNMNVAVGHKGIHSYIATVRGLEAHSSLTPQGVNTIEYAADLITYLKSMVARFAKEGPFDDAYDITHTTVHTGLIQGGVTVHIVPRDCSFEFEFRNLSEHNAKGIIEEIRRYANEQLVPAMKAISPVAGIEVRDNIHVPGLSTHVDANVVTFVKSLAGRNDHIKVAFGTEAGLFDEHVGIPTVVCGPGSIEQAHKPDEYITLDQVSQCEQFMERLIDKVR